MKIIKKFNMLFCASKILSMNWGRHFVRKTNKLLQFNSFQEIEKVKNKNNFYRSISKRWKKLEKVKNNAFQSWIDRSKAKRRNTTKTKKNTTKREATSFRCVKKKEKIKKWKSTIKYRKQIKWDVHILKEWAIPLIQGGNNYII
jgi:hypothetical protein